MSKAKNIFRHKDHNSFREEAFPVKKKNDITTRLVYGSLISFGAGSLSLAAIATYITPFFDQNVARVLLPVSGAFLLMVVLDYLLRGREHVGA